jgi:8-oxo-dGTP diphosphatase
MTHLKEYVLGFCFDPTEQYVILIEKNRPLWQKGLLNGVGGKIEHGELPLEAMNREFFEETGLTVSDWTQYAILSGSDFKIHIFSGHGNPAEAKSITDEQIVTAEVSCLDETQTISNLKWLVPMALSVKYDSCKFFDICEIK